MPMTEMADRSRKSLVVPAKAGTRRRLSNDTGFPLSYQNERE
jgi:hypothetical protein